MDIINIVQKNSFIDYFWSVRNIAVSIWELVKIARHVPKVKVFHSISTGYAGFLGALLHYQYKRPFILTEHGIYTKERWIDLLQKWWTEKTLHAGKQSQEDSEYLVKIWIGFFENLGRMCYASANPIISLFEAYRQRQIQDGAEKDRTRIIPNAVNTKKYNWPHKKTPDATNPIVCLIGRVVPIKDIKTFIRAVGILSTKISTIQGWIVGSDEENPEYVTECKNLVNIMGLTKCIDFTGEKDLTTIFPKIDLLLLSSISEGLPLVILEAFAAGIPVVATDVGACSELIYGNTKEDRALGAAGTIVSIANPEALAAAVLQLLQHPEQWLAAQKVGVERVTRFYNMGKFIEQYTDVYKGALG